MISGCDVLGSIRTGGQTVDLSGVAAMYLRPHDSRRLPIIADQGEGSLAWRNAVDVEDTLLSWAEITAAFMVNRPSAMATNASKPYQARLIQSLGFEIPETMLTTDPNVVLAFWERRGTVIYKSISGVRSIVSRLTAEHRSRLDDVVWCPTQFPAVCAWTRLSSPCDRWRDLRLRDRVDGRRLPVCSSTRSRRRHPPMHPANAVC
jgi:hypothetical protein